MLTTQRPHERPQHLRDRRRSPGRAGAAAIHEQPTQSDQQKPQPQMSSDRIEEALRKVRERQQEKRDRDRQLKMQAIGRTPVDKDW